MEIPLISGSPTLIQMICVIIVATYLLTGGRFFTGALDGRPIIRARIILTLIFGDLSVYGTVSGIEVLYTDRVADDPSEKTSGEERLQTLIRNYHHLSSKDIMDQILRKVRVFSAGHPQSDDITLMILKAV